MRDFFEALNKGKLTALLIAMLLFFIAKLSTTNEIWQHVENSKQFTFKSSILSNANSKVSKQIRNVHPDYEHIAGWISSVGAGVAIGDLNSDGISDDICLVDPRDDTVTIFNFDSATDTAVPIHKINTSYSGYEPKTIAPMGCIFADVNADGTEDIIVYYWGRTPLVFVNVSSGENLTLTPTEIINDREIWYTNAALFSDIDGDGFGDLMFGNYFPDGSGVLDVDGTRAVEMQHSMSRAGNAGRNRLFLNEGAKSGIVKFADYSPVLNVVSPDGWTLALGSADLDGDLLPELYIANDFGKDRLLLNMSTPGTPHFQRIEGERRFTDPRSTTLGQDSFKGMGVDFSDINSDGKFDIFVSNIAEEYALNESHFLFASTGEQDLWQQGVAPYRNMSGPLGVARTSWSWDAKFGDFDNDGLPELVQATGFVRGKIDRWPELHELAMGNDELLKYPEVWPQFGLGDDISGDRADVFFTQNENHRFQDIAREIGLGSAAVSRGVATSDIDGDGDLDFAIARQWEPSVFFLNQSRNQNSSITLNLRLSNANGTSRAAVGANAKLLTQNTVLKTGFSDVSNGHSGKRSGEIHFGLAEYPKNQTINIELMWRDASGHHRRTTALKPGRHKIILDELQPSETALNAGASRK